MTDNALTPQQSFEENIKDRLRADIGGLLPDAALSEMVSKAVQTIFFNRTEKKEGSWGHTTVIPSWFEQEVAKLLNQRIKDDIDKYMDTEGAKLVDMTAKQLAKEAPNIIASVFVQFMRPNGSYTNNLDTVVTNVLRAKGYNV